jgi:hypothetical protein
MSKLTVNEANGDFTHVIRLSAADIVAAGTSSVAFASIPAGGAIDVAFATESSAIAGATDITLDVGTGTDVDTLIDNFDLDANNGAPVYNTGTSFVQAAGNTTIAGGAQPVEQKSSATDVIYTFGGTTGDVTGGEVIIGVRIFDPLRFSQA